jgi:hypothetical protein
VATCGQAAWVDREIAELVYRDAHCQLVPGLSR